MIPSVMITALVGLMAAPPSAALDRAEPPAVLRTVAQADVPDQSPGMQGTDPGSPDVLTYVLASGMIEALVLIGIFAVLFVLRTRRAHMERRRFAAELIDNIPIGLLVVSPEGRIEFANSEIVERTPDGRNTLVAGASYREAIASLIARDIIDRGALTPDQMLEDMTVAGLQDGYRRDYDLTNGGAFVRTTKRLRDGALLLLRQDVTDYRRQMAEIQTLNKQLHNQIELANASNEDLRAFAYATSHDLKAPTNTSTMLIRVLRDQLDGRLSPDEQEFFDDLETTNRNMGELVDSVLEYTNAIGAPMVHQHVNLDQVAKQCVSDLRASIQETDTDIRIGPLPHLQGHPTQMRQLLQNLLSNAIRFRHPDRLPVIEVKQRPAPDGMVGFCVCDNGIGIPPGHRDRIFKVFARLNNASEYGGSGLGLAICHRIALNHEGQIRVRARRQGGTCFEIILKGAQSDRTSDGHRRQHDRPEAEPQGDRAVGTG